MIAESAQGVSNNAEKAPSRVRGFQIMLKVFELCWKRFETYGGVTNHDGKAANRSETLQRELKAFQTNNAATY